MPAKAQQRTQGRWCGRVFARFVLLGKRQFCGVEPSRLDAEDGEWTRIYAEERHERIFSPGVQSSARILGMSMRTWAARRMQMKMPVTMPTR